METDRTDTVFARLVQLILSDGQFQGAVLGSDEEERKAMLYAFVEREYPELSRKPEELAAKQNAVCESFNQVLRTIDMAEIGKLRDLINDQPHIAIPI